MDIIQKHIFLDANKRTATEAAMMFLGKNSFMLETSTAGKVYISLKIANGEIKYEERISRKEALKEIDRLLKKDKEFLEIMAKM